MNSKSYLNKYILFVLFLVVSMVIFLQKSEVAGWYNLKVQENITKRSGLLGGEYGAAKQFNYKEQRQSEPTVDLVESRSISESDNVEAKEVAIKVNGGASSVSDITVDPNTRFFRLGQKYANQLPQLYREKMAGNYIDIDRTFYLLQRAGNANAAAKLEYETILNELKIHADTGDIRAQIDYAMFMALNSSSRAYPDPSQRIIFAETSKEYYIKAAVSGQAQAAVAISNNAIREPIKDPVEALAWGLIGARLGARSAELVVCIQYKAPCTEEMFYSAGERARFYIDFYEFKQSK